MANLLGYLLLCYAPGPFAAATRNPHTAFGRWCLSHAGGWVYRGYVAGALPEGGAL